MIPTPTSGQENRRSLGKRRSFGRESKFVAIACTTGFLISPATLVYDIFGLFVEPIQNQFNWSLGDIYFALLIFTLAVAAMSIPVASAVDRWGPTKVLGASFLLYGLAFSQFLFVKSLLGFYVAFVILGITSSGANSVPYIRLLSSWFDKNRGLAIGIATSGTGIGMLLLPWPVVVSISVFGWQAAYSVIGLLATVIGVTIFGFLVTDRPEQIGLERENPADTEHAAAEKNLPPISMKELALSRRFQLLALCFLCITGSVYAVSAHLAPMIRAAGGSIPLAAAVVSVFGVSTIAGRIGTGWIMDRISPTIACAVIFASSAIMIGTISIYPRPSIIFFGASLVGISAGAEMGAMGLLASRYFGEATVAKAYALLTVIILLSISTCPYLLALSFEATGTYSAGLAACVVLNLVSIACLVSVGRLSPNIQNEMSGMSGTPALEQNKS